MEPVFLQPDDPEFLFFETGALTEIEERTISILGSEIWNWRLGFLGRWEGERCFIALGMTLEVDIFQTFRKVVVWLEDWCWGWIWVINVYNNGGHKQIEQPKDGESFGLD